MKLWGGRFSSETDKYANDFNSSISFDQRMYRQDIKGSIAHARMLGKCGIIALSESEEIIKGLEDILKDIENGKIEFSADAEDIHMNIETILTERIGNVGKKLHTGRSRNDQVALDTRMYVRDEIKEIKTLLDNLLNALIDISENNLETIMPGYTHLQKAQPVTLAHHFMAYHEMFQRDKERLSDCFKRVNVMPLGSGALAATTYPIGREMVKEELGFDRITNNSMDAVSDRDFVIETVFCLSLLMVHISRFCEELILWSSNEFGFIELSDSFSTGSSIMPQKKNPDIAELSRGKSARIIGNLITLLSLMKSLPLAYNKDMQEDKPALFDSIDNVKLCLKVFTPMIQTTVFKTDVMKVASEGGFSNATDLADYLVGKGIPFRDAHEITGKLVAFCLRYNISLGDVPLDVFKQFSNLIEIDVYVALDILSCVKRRNIPGGPAPESVKKHIESIKKNP